MQILLEGGADPNKASLSGWTPLLACINAETKETGNVNKDDQIAIVKALLAKGADPNQAGANGLTPLWECVEKKRDIGECVSDLRDLIFQW